MDVELLILGGPWDGARGLWWVAEESAPETILVGACTGDNECGEELCTGAGHAAYWLLEEEFYPQSVVTYKKADEHTVRVPSGTEGRAIYSIDGQLGGHRPQASASRPIKLGTAIKVDGRHATVAL